MTPLPSGMPTTGTTSLSHVLSRRAAGTTSLDGTWKAIPDPYDVGGFSLLGPAKTVGFAIATPASGRTHRIRLRRVARSGGARRLEHPNPRVALLRGLALVPPTLHRDREESGRTFVHFGAVNHSCTIYLDGDVLASRRRLRPVRRRGHRTPGRGEHSLVVLVDCIRKPDRVPAMRTDWFNFGGLHRSVDLVGVPSTFISSVAHHGADGSLVGEVDVDGDAPPRLVSRSPTRMVTGGHAQQRFTVSTTVAPNTSAGTRAPRLCKVVFETGTIRGRLGRLPHRRGREEATSSSMARWFS